jgi:hypothetical protein
MGRSFPSTDERSTAAPGGTGCRESGGRRRAHRRPGRYGAARSERGESHGGPGRPDRPRDRRAPGHAARLGARGQCDHQDLSARRLPGRSRPEVGCHSRPASSMSIRRFWMTSYSSKTSRAPWGSAASSSASMRARRSTDLVLVGEVARATDALKPRHDRDDSAHGGDAPKYGALRRPRLSRAAARRDRHVLVVCFLPVAHSG